ncbi:S1C family serine protease [Nocardioides daejeonensis]|uniref:S1C family serine protease n=1 Tax=Nocardioides daejeonensis TaxID=1046556 RepID=UPI0013A54764|nr:trypsin-like peptidase domain-containing protein [Nocardioides daejeonensis]
MNDERHDDASTPEQPGQPDDLQHTAPYAAAREPSVEEHLQSFPAPRPEDRVGPHFPPPGRFVAAQPVAVPPRRGPGLAAVAFLALLLGLVGGGLASVGYDYWQDQNDDPGRNRDGLAGVDLVDLPPLKADNGSVAAVAQELLPSTVQIIADYQGEEGGATGSGFLLDKQGHVVTNNHVIEDAAKSDGKIQVVDVDHHRYDATIVGRSTVYDLAVLYVEDAADKLQPAALGRSTTLRVGEPVVAIGSPLGLSATVTSGIVSALNRPVTTGGDAKDLNSYINAVQTDAAINPGNSGGPLVNLRGEVVGVNSAIATNGAPSGEAGNIGVGFAIPVEQVRITADQILRDGEAQYPVIGAQVITDKSGEGVLIDEVTKGGAAEKAGLKKGDVVRELNDRVVVDSPSLIVAIRAHVPGDTVTLTVTRDGKERDIKVTLDAKVG